MKMKRSAVSQTNIPTMFKFECLCNFILQSQMLASIINNRPLVFFSNNFKAPMTQL